MTSLHHLQQAFRAALLNERADAAAVPMLDSAALQRLAIYRNNIAASLCEALTKTFPVVCRLVGRHYFDHAATAFIRTSPPSEPRLSHYGAGFADFLARFCPSLPYLADVSRLEWLINEAIHESAMPSITLAQASLGARSGDVFLQLQPSVRVFESTWPALAIWQANQPQIADPPELDIVQSEEYLLVHRRQDQIVLTRTDAATATFVGLLCQGASLKDATVAALSLDPMFDLATALALLFSSDLVIDQAQATASSPTAHKE
jgi:hypothetical protein